VSPALFAIAGLLLGGAWSMRRQQAPTPLVAVLVVLALLALAGGVAWWGGRP
jgi:membrane protein DedA with SNARE-associated domain